MKNKRNNGLLAKLCQMDNNAYAGYIAPWWLMRTFGERYPEESRSACSRQGDAGARIQQRLRA